MTKLSGLNIIPFQITATQQLIDVINNVCADIPWMRTTHFEPTPAWQHVLEREDSSDHLLVLAKVEEQVIGWCRLFPIYGSMVDLGIGVSKPYRRQGVGTALIEYTTVWAKKEDVREILLTTHIKNKPAIGLFEKFEFGVQQKEGERLRMGLEVDKKTINKNYIG